MKKIGIIQPGAMGDIILLLPAAKYLHDQGNHVIMPIFEDFMWMFTEVIDYITFVPIPRNVYTAIKNSNILLKNTYKVDQIYDLAATFPESLATKDYVNSGDGYGEHYDVFKYKLLNIPIEEKWKLYYKRDYNKENKVYNDLVKNKKYAVTCTSCSQGKYNFNFDIKDGQLIEMNTNYNVFHWTKVFENAHTIAVVNTGVLNLVEQLNISCRKIVFPVPSARFPILKNNWEVING